ncbi:hypothetical protein PIB30_086854 [Stylosanthes scabra]|uniref:Uncharacterized protein n=1 Tax=Stylosanthes scabra TaxID=79078 RepID=A0ABU6TVK1_9FABA|nr:hypothetical protein [Stylosanthes scabra]
MAVIDVAAVFSSGRRIGLELGLEAPSSPSSNGLSRGTRKQQQQRRRFPIVSLAHKMEEEMSIEVDDTSTSIVSSAGSAIASSLLRRVSKFADMKGKEKFESSFFG